MTLKGRINPSNHFIDTVPQKSAEQAMLIKMDEIIDRLNAISVAIEAATDGSTLFTELDVAAIKASISKVILK